MTSLSIICFYQFLCLITSHLHCEHLPRVCLSSDLTSFCLLDISIVWLAHTFLSCLPSGKEAGKFLGGREAEEEKVQELERCGVRRKDGGTKVEWKKFLGGA